LGGRRVKLTSACIVSDDDLRMLLSAALLSAQTLVVGILTDPVSLDPHRATDLVSAAVVANVCEPLVRYRADGSRPQAALATTWTSVDSRTWTFTLREGVRFHDGAPLDAGAVVANLEALRRTRAFPGRAERVGPHVVSVVLDRPNAALLATLSQPFFAMQSPRELSAGSRRPVGTGPFRFSAARPGQVVLEQHLAYWNGPARLKQVVFRRYRDPQALAAALLRADVDVTSSLTPERVDLLHDAPEVALDSQTGLNIALLSINNERPPFDDVRVRRALTRAIDRAALVRDVLGGHGEAARNPLPPSIWGYASRAPELALDRTGARRLLAQAGLASGFECALTFADVPRPYLPAPAELARRVAADLAQVGIRARLRRVESWAQYLERATRGDYELAVLGWQADTTDPNDFLSVLLASEAVGTTNRSRYSSAAMDALLKQGRRGRGQQERTASYRAAQDLFHKDAPWVPLYHVSSLTAYRKHVQGLVVGTTGLLRYEKVWKKP
jgi:peptide/nickel transport system substrate-binding protein